MNVSNSSDVFFDAEDVTPFGTPKASEERQRKLVDQQEPIFEQQLKAWTDQFESWKAKNIVHKNEEVFVQYEKEWTDWRTAVLHKRKQMQKAKAERPAASAAVATNQAPSISTATPALHPSAVLSYQQAQDTHLQRYIFPWGTLAVAPAASLHPGQQFPSKGYSQPHTYPWGMPAVAPAASVYPAQQFPCRTSKGYGQPQCASAKEMQQSNSNREQYQRDTNFGRNRKARGRGARDQRVSGDVRGRPRGRGGCGGRWDPSNDMSSRIRPDYNYTIQAGIGLSSQPNSTIRTDGVDFSFASIGPLGRDFIPSKSRCISSQDSSRASADHPRKRFKKESVKLYKADERGKLPNKVMLPKYSCFNFSFLKLKPGLIDTHCHLDWLFQRQKFSKTHADFMNMHKDTYPSNYEGCVAVFCDPFSFRKTEMWAKYLEETNVWGAFGCHPKNSRYYNDSREAELFFALEHRKVRALGEIGLDYSERSDCPKEIQHKVMRRQLHIAMRQRLPLVIHCRDANDDCLKIMKEVLPRDYAIHLHCFTDSWNCALEWLREFPNLMIGLTNLVTFQSAKSTHDVAKRISMHRLVLETDAPYFVPSKAPRGCRFSHPGMAIHVASQIAALRDMSLEEVLHWTRQNTEKLYGI